MMQWNHFQDRLLTAAQKEGFTDAEVYIVGGRSLEVRVYEGQVSHYENSREQGISFRGLFDGKMGYAYSEKLSEDIIDWLLTEARANARLLPEDEKEDLFAGAPWQPTDTYDTKLAQTEPKMLIDIAHALEKGALSEGERIQTVEYAVAEYMESSRLIANTLGLSVQDQSNLVMAFALARAREGSATKQGIEMWQGRDLAKLKADAIGRQAARRAIGLLGAQPIPSGQRPVLLEQRVATDLLKAFLPIFFADKVQQGFSLLGPQKDKIMASDCLSLVDDPFHPQSYFRPAFDSEGVPTQKTTLIEQGRLQNFLHSRKTAAKEQTESTGNGFKPSWKAKVEVAATNSLIVPGSASLQDLQNKMDTGFQVTNLTGLHAGTNLVSGDFSLSAEGFWLEKGAVTAAVDQVTVAGNFYELLKQVAAVANDLYIGLPQGGGQTGSPSLLIDSLSISGS